MIGKSELVNTNKLIRNYTGATGLKTGSTSVALYNLSATATRNGLSLIAVIMKAPTTKIRFAEAQKLLDYGFNTKSLKIIKKKDKLIKKIKLEKSTKKEIKIYPKNDITILKDKNQNNEKYKTKIKLEKIKLPIQKNKIVGKIEVYQNKKKIKEEKLIVKEKVEKLTYLKLLIENLKNIPKGIIK